MFNMSAPWWEFVLRAAVVYIFLLISLRLSGKRQIGQLAPFDFILLLVLSNAVQNSMNGGDNSLVAGLISALTLILLNYFVGYLTFKSKRLESFIDGTPLFLIENGVLNTKIMKREQMTLLELEASTRHAGILAIKEVKFAILETNGAISFIKY